MDAPAKVVPGPLRVAGIADCEALAKLHGSHFPRGWSTAEIAALIAEPAVTTIIAGPGDRPMGFVMVRMAADEAEILTLAVVRDAERRGFGRLLLDGAITAAASAGARRLFLEVAADNEAALALYRRAGFTEVGRRRGYYREGQGIAVDAAILARGIEPFVDAGGTDS